MQPRMRCDEAAWAKIKEVAVLQLIEPAVLNSVGKFLLEPDETNDPEIITSVGKLSAIVFSIAFWMTYKTCATIIRFLQPGAIIIPKEKARYEVVILLLTTP